jgi:hypothetical protein
LLAGQGMRDIYGGADHGSAVMHSVFLRIRVVY